MKVLHTLFLMIALVAGSTFAHAEQMAPAASQSYCGLDQDKVLEEVQPASPAQPAATSAGAARP
jgi:hypothetical protein